MSRTAKKSDRLSQGPDWSFELIQQYDEEIGKIAKEFGLDTYPNQIEIISSEQMMDAYASVGMPLGYHHWSYGKQFLDWITLQLQKKDFKAIELNAYKENKAGHRFYNREGFVHLGFHFVKSL